MTPETDQIERRLWPRSAAPAKLECRMELRTRVRLLDISMTGALLASEVRLPLGTRAQLRSSVSAASFTPGVQVRRTAAASGRREGASLGAVFTAMDDRSRRSLEEFLRKASL
jgi:hypothetical protein